MWRKNRQRTENWNRGNAEWKRIWVSRMRERVGRRERERKKKEIKKKRERERKREDKREEERGRERESRNVIALFSPTHTM